MYPQEAQYLILLKDQDQNNKEMQKEEGKGRSSYLDEKWYTVTRVSFESGHIDNVLVRASDNPNNEYKKRYGVSTLQRYYRLNDGEWVSAKEFKDRNFHHTIYQLPYNENIKELWEKTIIQRNHNHNQEVQD